MRCKIDMKTRAWHDSSFCIWGCQCALCPWVGSDTLLHLSPRPTVNLKWRKTEKQTLEGKWHIVVSPSCSGYLYLHCPVTLHSFPSTSLTLIPRHPYWRIYLCRTHTYHLVQQRQMQNLQHLSCCCPQSYSDNFNAESVMYICEPITIGLL